MPIKLPNNFGSKDNLVSGEAIGQALSRPVMRQIQNRANLKAKTNKNDEEITLLNSNTGWVKLSSSININGSSKTAKEHILFGGTLYQEETQFKVRQGFDFNEPYSKSGIPTDTSYVNNAADRGIVPTPGITSFKFEYKGQAAASSRTNIQFKLFDINQFTLFEELYFKLGTFMLIEFGNTMYLDNQNNVVNGPDTVSNFFNENISYADIETQITELIEKSDYNYDAKLCIVSNYSVKMEKDGSYTVDLTLSGKGEVIEALDPTGEPNTELMSPLEMSDRVRSAALMEDLATIKQEVEKDPSSHTSPLIEILNIYEKETDRDLALEKVNEKGYNTCEWREKDKPLFLCKANSKSSTDLNMVYIRFETWIKMMNDTLIPRFNKKEKCIKLGYGGMYSKYTTYANHFALDPTISILPKLPQNENLYTAWRQKQNFATGKPDNIYDIWLNVSMLKNTLEKMIEDSFSSHVNLVEYITTVLRKVEENMGGYSQLRLHYLDDISTFVVVDDVVLSGYNFENSEINIQGLSSLITDVSLSTKADSALATEAAIKAADPEYFAGVSYGNPVIVSHLGRSEDRLKLKVDDPKGTQVSKEPPLTLYDQYEKIINEFVKNKQILTDDLKAASVNFYQATQGEINRLYPISTHQLPFLLSMTLDGIGGIKFMQQFKVAPGLLPDYLSDRCVYQVFGIEHSITNNKWETSISAIPQFQFGPSGERYEEKIDTRFKKTLNSDVSDALENETKTE